MKPWQVEFHLVPRPRPGRETLAAVPGPRAWSAERPLPGDFSRRAAMLGLAPAADPPGAKAAAWGDVEGNRIEVREAGEGAGGASVRVAVDARKLDPAFAAALLGLVRAVNGVLVRADGLMIDGTVGAFSKALRSSPAWKYVEDPTGLLTGRERLDDDEA